MLATFEKDQNSDTFLPFRNTLLKSELCNIRFFPFIQDKTVYSVTSPYIAMDNTLGKDVV